VTDYGHELRFGAFLTPDAAEPERVIQLAVHCDQVGLDLVTAQDHPYQARYLDTWTLLTAIAARTGAVRIAPNVANLPLRPPAVLARAVASLDRISGGRVDLGLGAGAFLDAVRAMGGPSLTAATSVDALVEAMTVLRGLWDTEQRSLRFEGEHYRVVGAHTGPAPLHRIEIWLGAYKPRMLRVTGAYADGWLPSLGYVTPEQLAELAPVLDEAALAAGRDPSAIRRLLNISGSFQGTGRELLQGPPAVWIEQLAELTLLTGTSCYILGTDDADDLSRFAQEVAPGVRELVAAERAGDLESVPVAPAVVASVESSGRPDEPPAPQPTLDDGVRVSGESAWDESTRPSAPAVEPAPRTAGQRAAGQHLIDVHDHLRHELVQVRDLVEQVARGLADPGATRSAINQMTLRQNNWTLGAYCEAYCRVLTTHHALEDASVFPHLRRAEPALAAVLDRLQAEHEAIHALLDRVDRALVAFVAAPDEVTEVRAAVDLLTDALRSHLSYEERELVDPLSRHGFY
jgi:alkanesulfonate monooxygenase SsuD/methylene tetrahydromethanopterin reductase-like flavin-dependent oxidoreductase (luciferase family)